METLLRELNDYREEVIQVLFEVNGCGEKEMGRA